MDLQSAAATELPKWEPFIRRFVARDWMRSRLAIETDDVRQECRWRALQAIVNLHHNKPHLVGKPDEIRIVNRAIARAFVDLIRKANRLSRCTDDTTKYTIESGASWLPMASTRTLEEEYLDGEREQDVRRACAEIQAIMGDDVYYDVLRVLDGERAVGATRAETLRASVRRRTAIRDVKRQLAASPDDRPRRPTMDKTAASLNDDNLARVALVYRKMQGAKVTTPARAHLLATVEALNSDGDGVTYPFPPCFTDGTQYDPNDSSCGTECDFRVECAACIPEHYDPAIEEQLVQLKGAGAPAPKPPKAEKPPKPAAAPKPTPKPDPEKKTAPTEKIQPPAAVVAPIQPPPEAPMKAEKKTAPEKPPAAKTKAPKPSKAEKPAKAPKAKAERGKTVLDAPIALSTRAGVLKGKTRKTRPDGKVWTRLPQGSAAELAALPVGTKRERDLDGVRYFVKKIKDGEVVTTGGGAERKRDGVWKLEAKAKLDKDGSPGAKTAIEPAVEGTLGVITRFVTGSNVWSAARFWSIIPALLDPKSPSFNPAKYKPVSIYAYGKDPAKREKRAKAAAKPKTKAKSKPAKKAKAAA